MYLRGQNANGPNGYGHIVCPGGIWDETAARITKKKQKIHNSMNFPENELVALTVQCTVGS